MPLLHSLSSCLPSLASIDTASSSHSNSIQIEIPPSPYSSISSPINSRSSIYSHPDSDNSFDSFHSSPDELHHLEQSSSPSKSLPIPFSIPRSTSRLSHMSPIVHDPEPVLWLHRHQARSFREIDPSPTRPLSPPESPKPSPQTISPALDSPPSPTARRPLAIAELLETEAIYAADLAVVREIYMARASGHPPGPAPLSAEDQRTIFGNIDQLAILADTFAKKLKLAAEANQVGGCFMAFLGAIERQFMIYCARYSASTKRLHEFEAQVSKKKLKSPSKSLKYSSNSSNGSGGSGSGGGGGSGSGNHNRRGQNVGLRYLRECQALSAGRTHAWDLGSLLIKPVQRCLKYPLLLDQIIRFTDPSDSDYAALVAARDGMVAVADTINETKRRAELVGALVGPTPRYLIRRRRGSSGTWPLMGELGPLIARTRGSAMALATLPLRLRVSAEALTQWVRAAERLTEAFRRVYVFKAPRPGGEAAWVGVGANTIKVERVQLMALRAACNGPLQHLQRRLEIEIIPSLNRILKLYDRPLMIIERLEKEREPDGRLEKVLLEELPRLEASARKAVEAVVAKWAVVVKVVEKDVAAMVRVAAEMGVERGDLE